MTHPTNSKRRDAFQREQAERHLQDTAIAWYISDRKHGVPHANALSAYRALVDLS